MEVGRTTRLLVIALAAALFGGCKTGRERGPPPPFNPPYSSAPLPEPPNHSAPQPAVIDSAVKLVAGTEAVSASEQALQPPSAPLPLEVIPAPAQPLPQLALSLFGAVEMGL